MRDYENSIVYNLVENNVLKMIESIERFKEYYKEYEDKCEIDEREISNSVLFSYRYSIDNDRYIDIYVERDRVIYLLLDKDLCELDEYVLENDELNDSMYC